MYWKYLSDTILYIAGVLILPQLLPYSVKVILGLSIHDSPKTADGM
jgi:hypothetical protein